jgi:hypothetical protein
VKQKLLMEIKARDLIRTRKFSGGAYPTTFLQFIELAGWYNSGKGCQLPKFVQDYFLIWKRREIVF